MWTREELKWKAKEVLKGNYWKFVCCKFSLYQFFMCVCV